MLPLKRRVKVFVTWQATVDAVRSGEIYPVQHQRIGESCVDPEGDLVFVPFDDRIDRFESQVSHPRILALMRNHLIERDIGRRSDLPILQLRVFTDYFGAEEADCTNVLERLRVDNRGHKTLAGITKNQQRSIVQRHRSEKAGFGVADSFYFLCGQFIAEDVRDAGEVGTAEKVFAVRRKDKSLGHGLPEVEFFLRRDVPFKQFVYVEDPQRLIPVDFSERR